MSVGHDEDGPTEMCTTNPSVLLFRAPKDGDEDPFEKALKEASYSPFSISVLEFHFQNIDKLVTSLLDGQKFLAIVLTSQRSVEAVSLALQSMEDEECPKEKKRKLCLDLPCFVVGESTAKEARKLGFEPDGDKSGNAEKLSDLIINKIQERDKPFLYPCGSLKRDTLPTKLRNAGFTLSEVTVYETVKSRCIRESVEQLVHTQKVALDYIVYFSPSGVQYTLDLLQDDTLPLKHSKIIAIGPSTQSELTKLEIQVHGTALNPNPAGVLAAMSTR
ncbi:uroporphyrinogen-III synthase-like [Mya arenaria]|uniref:uroporphyrinogen-III synthase-like n=1 Tax=Mya arenaria TaxID=6604 RepID=UPI0022E1D680|nr:uroporphyrinogen-III synthase-like [Mya arenaria]